MRYGFYIKNSQISDVLDMMERYDSIKQIDTPRTREGMVYFYIDIEVGQYHEFYEELEAYKTKRKNNWKFNILMLVLELILFSQLIRLFNQGVTPKDLLVLMAGILFVNIVSWLINI